VLVVSMSSHLNAKPAILILPRTVEGGVLREGSVANWVGEMQPRRWKVGLVREGGWLKA